MISFKEWIIRRTGPQPIVGLEGLEGIGDFDRAQRSHDMAYDKECESKTKCGKENILTPNTKVKA